LNIPEKETYASPHDNRTKEDIDGIDIYDDVILMTERKKTYQSFHYLTI
jgi:hypothetical protein